MTQEFLNYVRNCSKDSKSSISTFLEQLFNEKTQTSNQQTQISSQQTQRSSQQSESQTNNFFKLEQLFNRISKKFSIQKSREISKDERCKKMLTNHEYNYGEITFKTIYKIFRKLKSFKTLSNNEIFYDLGSGSGKVIFGAGLCYSFLKCKGIQFLESLYASSLQLKQKILSHKNEIQQNINQFLHEDEYHLPLIQIINCDFKTQDWSDATVVYVSSTCYSTQVMKQISLLSRKLTKGTILITLTQALNDHHWKILDKFQGETSWGFCTIFIHLKVEDSQRNKDNLQINYNRQTQIFTKTQTSSNTTQFTKLNSITKQKRNQ